MFSSSNSYQRGPSKNISIHSIILRSDQLSLQRLSNYPADTKFYWSSPTNGSHLTLGRLVTLRENGLNRFTELLKKLDHLKDIQVTNQAAEEYPNQARPRFFGGISFHPKKKLNFPWSQFEPAQFSLPRIQLYRENSKLWITINQIGPANDDYTDIFRKLRRFDSNYPKTSPKREFNIVSDQTHPRKDNWINDVRKIVNLCKNKSIIKIVLAQERNLQLDKPITLSHAVRQLEQSHEEGYNFLMQPGNNKFFTGVSPEKLLSKNGLILESESLAGTIESDSDEETRDELAQELIEDSKNQTEHMHVAKFLKNRLSLMVNSLETVPQTVRSLPELQHLLTVFQGNLETNTHILELVRDLHPTPAVGGMPHGLATSYLREHEDLERGYYASPVGWFDFQGDGEFCVAIRSSLVKGTKLRFFAGAGIIDESNPEKEWNEVQLKYKSIMRTLLNQSL